MKTEFDYFYTVFFDLPVVFEYSDVVYFVYTFLIIVYNFLF